MRLFVATANGRKVPKLHITDFEIHGTSDTTTTMASADIDATLDGCISVQEAQKVFPDLADANIISTGLGPMLSSDRTEGNINYGMLLDPQMTDCIRSASVLMRRRTP